MTSADILALLAFLERVLAVANGKGGVGKTSTACHLAAAVARRKQRVLLIDLDPQSNAQDNLGYDNDDNGRGLVHAVMLGVAPNIYRDVRPGLDVIPGGVELEKLADHILSQRMRADDNDAAAAALLAVARVIAALAGDYDLIVIDCPPANSGILQDAAFAMARYVLVPTNSDASSRRGIAEIARRFDRIQKLANPHLTLLGVLLFGITGSAVTVERAARGWIEQALGGQAPVFAATVRQAERAAFDLREVGRLAFELAEEPGASASMKGLGGDYLALGGEVVHRLAELEGAAR